VHKDQVPGFRLTRQRLAILEVLRNSSHHPDASWVYQQVREGHPSISMGTVYRNLAQLAEAGLIRQIRCGDQAGHWDGRTTCHGHAICARCGRIVDIEVSDLVDQLARVAAQSGYRIEAHSLCLAGICPDCQAADRKDSSSRMGT